MENGEGIKEGTRDQKKRKRETGRNWIERQRQRTERHRNKEIVNTERE